jgi:hypothetical protein
MATKPNKKLAVLERRHQVAQLYLQGWTQQAIARQLEVVQSTICTDLQQIRREWRASSIRDFDEARAVELQKIDQLEREAWAAWERSQKPLQTAVVTGQGAGERTRKSLTNQYGDPRFLEVVHKCIAQRRALLGLDTTVPRDLDAHDELTPDVRGTRFLALLAELGGPPRLEAGRPAPGAVQPRLPGAG